MNPALQQRPDSRVRIDRYVVLSRLGRGGMGTVYRALDEDLEREVALKVLTLEGGLESESRKRFAVEAKAAAQLQHPNIVTIYQLGEAHGFPFIAMELLDGVDLETLMRAGEKLLLAEKLDIVTQVCHGLAYAHERRIVHRDIKPSNIRLLDDGGVKIMDFGIAKLSGLNLTQSGMVIGTVHYMSPEQVRGVALDGRSDVFSVGIVLQELLSGTRPFEGSTATEILYKIVHEPAPPLPLPPDVATGRLQQILDRALAKDVEQRYANAATMAEELTEVQQLLARREDRASEERTAEEISHVRRLLREGHAEEAVTRLTALERVQPESLDVRRVQRVARRQLSQPPAVQTELDQTDFPELAASLELAATRRSGQTRPVEGAERPRAIRRGLVWLGSTLVLLAVLAGGALLLLRAPGTRPASRLEVRSEPPGAAILVDGVASGQQTNAQLTLAPSLRHMTLTLRKQGYQEARQELTLPLPDQRPVHLQLVPDQTPLSVVSEPPGAGVSLDGQRLTGRAPLSFALDRSKEHRLSVTLDGHVSQEQVLAAGFERRELSVKLEPLGPLSLVSITSDYPLDVSWNGKLLARAQVSPQVKLPPGRHTLVLAAPTVFLKASTDVTTRDGQPATLDAPGLGRVNVQALPDNCEVHIDGVFADYPPILDRQIAAGTHRVQFRWPGGGRREEDVEIEAGHTAFVTGQRD